MSFAQEFGKGIRRVVQVAPTFEDITGIDIGLGLDPQTAAPEPLYQRDSQSVPVKPKTGTGLKSLWDSIPAQAKPFIGYGATGIGLFLVYKALK